MNVVMLKGNICCKVMKKSYAMKDKMLGNKSININIMISKVIKATMTFVEAKSNGVQLSGGGTILDLTLRLSIEAQ